jgi:ABC-type uncharacterized transport system auxiliary subunit
MNVTFPFRTLAVAIAGLLVLVACSAAPVRSPDTHYDLDVAMAPVGFGAEVAIALRRVDVRGLQSGRSLVIVTGTDPVRFQEQRGHFWHVATPSLIERAFLTTMNEASTDAAFGTSDSFDKIDYRLVLTVSRFAYVPGGEAMVDFDATVNAADGDVLLARSYWGRAALAGEAPADGVNALGVAFGEAMTVFAGELAGELAAALPVGQD